MRNKQVEFNRKVKFYCVHVFQTVRSQCKCKFLFHTVADKCPHELIFHPESRKWKFKVYILYNARTMLITIVGLYFVFDQYNLILRNKTIHDKRKKHRSFSSSLVRHSLKRKLPMFSFTVCLLENVFLAFHVSNRVISVFVGGRPNSVFKNFGILLTMLICRTTLAL